MATARLKTRKIPIKQRDPLLIAEGPLLEEVTGLHEAGFLLAGELEEIFFDEDIEEISNGDFDKIAIIETNRAVRAALDVCKEADISAAAKALEKAQTALTRAQRTAYHSPSTQSKLAIKLGARIVNHARLLFQESKYQHSKVQ